MFKIIKISSSLGAPDINCGMEKGPLILSKYLVSKKFSLISKHSIDLKIPAIKNSRQEKTKNVFSVVSLNRLIKNKVISLMDEQFKPLILMGDCSSSIGVVYGILSQSKKIGIVWFDAHGDFNTPEISPSGCLHGMGLAHVAGYGDKLILKINYPNRFLKSSQIIMFGQRNLDKQEEVFIKKLHVKLLSGKECKNISNKALDVAFSKFKEQGITDIYLHYDMDVIDAKERPAVLAPSSSGVFQEELIKISKYIRDRFNILGIGISNYIPRKDKNNYFSEYIIRLIGILTTMPKSKINKKILLRLKNKKISQDLVVKEMGKIENYINKLQNKSSIDLNISLRDFVITRR